MSIAEAPEQKAAAYSAAATAEVSIGVEVAVNIAVQVAAYSAVEAVAYSAAARELWNEVPPGLDSEAQAAIQIEA